MNVKEIFEISAAVITSLGGATLLLMAFSGWLGKLWAERILQNDKANNEKVLEELKKELDFLKQKELTRHFDKLSVYKEIIYLVSEILRELEAVSSGKQPYVTPEVESNFSLNRNKVYGYISLISNQEVMDKYNDMIDFLIPVIYESKKETWSDMRIKADALLNAMRLDLGIKDSAITYRGNR